MDVVAPAPDLETAKFALEILKLAVMVVAFFYLRLLAGQRRTDEAHDEHERTVDKRLDRVEQAFVRLDERMSHMPDSESVGRIHKRLDDLTIQMARSEGRQETIAELTKSFNAMFLRAAERKTES